MEHRTHSTHCVSRKSSLGSPALLTNRNERFWAAWGFNWFFTLWDQNIRRTAESVRLRLIHKRSAEMIQRQGGPDVAALAVL